MIQDYETAFYEALTSNNVNHLQTLMGKCDKNELEEAISNAYFKVRCNNVPLSLESDFVIREKLIDLRFYEENDKNVPKTNITVENIKERIDMLMVDIDSIVKHVDVNDQVLYTLTFIAKNIRNLKIRLASTFDSLPWEEIEFCLVSFLASIQPYLRGDFGFGFGLSFKRLSCHLQYFSRCLETKTENILATSIKVLNKITKTSCEENAQKVIKMFPDFKDLYEDYERLRDLHSLEVIGSYVNLALIANPRELEGKFAILRAFLIIGEYMKDTRDTPKLSYATKELLIAALPKNTPEIVYKLRDSLSKTDMLCKRLHIERIEDIISDLHSDFTKIRDAVYSNTCNSKLDILLNSEKLLLLNDTFHNETKKIGKSALTDLVRINNCYQRGKQMINLKQEMFDASRRGHLETLQDVLKKGGDVRSRNFQLKTTLHFACQQRNLDVVKFLSERHVDVNAKDIKGQSPLHIAADFGRWSIVEFLIFEKNVDVNIIDLNLRTPLHLAAQRGCKQVVKCLLYYKASHRVQDKYGYSPLHYAVRNKHRSVVVKLLKLENRVDENKTFGGYTALHIAAETGHLGNIKLLLKKRANVNAQSDRQCTPLHLAMKGNNLDVVKILVSHGSKIHTKSITMATPLHQAAIYSHKGVLDFLILSGADVDVLDDMTGSSPLSFAAEHGNIEAVELLLEKKANSTLANKNKMIPLHFAASNGHYEIARLLVTKNSINYQNCEGHSALHISSLNGHGEIVKLLVEEGADVHLKEKNGCTALHLAAEKGHVYIVKYLVVKHSNLIEEKDVNDFTALHFSCIYQHADVVRSLINNGADVNSPGLLGITPFHLALGTGPREIVELVMATDKAKYTSTCKCFSPLHLCALNGDIEVFEHVLKMINSFSKTTASGYTPLHLSVQSKHKPLVRVLLSKIKEESVLNVMDNSNHSPLHYAIMQNSKDIVEDIIQKISAINNDENKSLLLAATFFGHEDIVEIILKSGKFNLDIRTEKKQTLLHLAAKNGHKRIVEMLLHFKIDPNIPSEKGLTPLHVAAIEGHSKIVDVLLQSRANAKIKTCNNYRAIGMAIMHGHLDIVKKLKESEEESDSEETDEYLLHVAVKANKIAIVKYLVYDKNYEIDSFDISRRKPIVLAVEAGKKEMVKFFLDLQPNFVHEISDSGATLLQIAAKFCHLKVAQYLIEKSIDINSKGRLGVTALHIALLRNKKSMSKLLLDNGSYIDEIEIQRLGNFPEIKLTKQLLNAIEKNRLSEVNRAITRKTNVNAKWLGLSTPLYLASWKGYSGIVDCLLKNKGDPNIKSYGYSPLHVACRLGNFSTVKQLLSHGAMFNILSDEGQSPRDLSLHPDIKNLLNLIENCFKCIDTNNVEDFRSLVIFKDISIAKAVMNCVNREKHNLITFALKRSFSSMELLSQDCQKDSSFILKQAKFYFAQEHYKKALQAYHIILMRRTEIFGSHNLVTLDITESIAEILFHHLKLTESLVNLKEVFLQRKNILGPEHETTLRAKASYSVVSFKKYRNVKYLRALEDIYSEARRFFGPDNKFLNEVLTHIANVLLLMGNNERALNICNELLQKYHSILGPDNLKTLIVRELKGTLLNKQGKHNEAFEVLQNVYETEINVLGLNHPQTLRTRREIATVQLSMSNNMIHLYILNEILNIQTEILENDHPDILITRNSIANALYSQDYFIGALDIYEADFETRKRTYFANHPEIVETASRINHIKLSIQLEIGTLNENITKHYSYTKIGRAIRNRDAGSLEDILGLDDEDDDRTNEQLHVNGNIFEENDLFDEDVRKLLKRQLSNESSFTKVGEFVERKSIEDRNAHGMASNEDPLRHLLKYVKMFIKDHNLVESDVPEDRNIFRFIRLINNVKKW